MPDLPPINTDPNPCNPASDMFRDGDMEQTYNNCSNELSACASVISTVHSTLTAWTSEVLGECSQGVAPCLEAITGLVWPDLSAAQGFCKELAETLLTSYQGELFAAAEIASMFASMLEEDEETLPEDTTPDTGPPTSPQPPEQLLDDTVTIDNPDITEPSTPKTPKDEPPLEQPKPKPPGGGVSPWSVIPVPESGDVELNEPDSKQADFCTSVLALRGSLITFGSAILKYPYIDLEYIANAFTDLFWTGQVSKKKLLELIGQQAFWSRETSAIVPISQAIQTEFPQVDLGTLRYLYAVRAIVVAVQSMEIGIQDQAATELAIQVHASPEIFGIGGGTDADEVITQAANTSWKLQVGVFDALPLIDMVIRFELPIGTPQIPEANLLYLTNQISLSKWQCLIRLQGGNPDEYYPVLVASRQTLNSDEAIAALRRQVLSESQFQDYMRQLGWINNDEIAAKVSLSEQIPGASDIIRFMVRDVFDPKIVGPFGLDAEFNDKFQGKLKYWTDAQGIDLDQIKSEWRSHWDIPSNQQLYEMLHRLRPNIVDPGIATTQEDVLRALGQNDVLPFWRQRLIAIAYRPLTRVDARRAYEIGAIDHDKLIDVLRDLGYDKSNAEILGEFYRRLKKKQQQGSEFVKAYKDGSITRNELHVILEPQGLTKAEVETLADYAIFQRKVAMRKSCTNAIKRRYIAGGLDIVETQTALGQNGLDPAQADLMIQEWTCERSLTEKHETAAQLCQWFDAGLIDDSEMLVRLMRLGYGSANAGRVAALCKAKREERESKAAETQAAKIKAMSLAAKKMEEKSVKDQQSAVAKEAARLQKEARERAARTKRLAKVGAKYAGKSGIDVEEALQALSALVAKLMSQRSLPAATAEDFAATAAETFDPESGVSLEELADQLADQAETIAELEGV